MRNRSPQPRDVEQYPSTIELWTDLRSWPLCVELAVDPQIFLYEAKLVQDCGFHRRVLPLAYKSESAAIWRQIEPCTPQCAMVTLHATWISIANASPGSHYRVTVSVRDAALEILDGTGLVSNPAWRTCQIGPADDPTDHGRMDMIILDSQDPAAKVPPADALKGVTQCGRN